MNWKNKFWEYATLCVVIVIILNPEMVELALCIDAVGLEMFIMLLDVQVVAVLCVFLNTKLRLFLGFTKYFYTHYIPPLTWKNIKETPEGLAFAAQSPAILMCALVFSSAIGAVLNL